MQTFNHSTRKELLSRSQILLDYVGGTNPIYVGYSHPGAETTEPKWQIMKLVYDGNNNVTSVQFSGGTPSGSFIWTKRATYTYA